MLKTDYKDDKYSGRRKYNQIENDDGTISLDDVTAYETSGDFFSAGDINGTNIQVNKNENACKNNSEEIVSIKALRKVLITASGWSSGAAPYTQIVAVPGMTVNDSPTIGLDASDGPSGEVADNRERCFGYVKRVVSDANTLTLYCFSSRPDTNFTILVKGV